ncbi:MAG: hypothetical protein IPH95_12940 [Candidatus Promineofilum sp.]|nr:hypothetical protein [Promineifilum sp.]
MVGNDEIARHAAEIYEGAQATAAPTTLATIRDRLTTIHDDDGLLATAYLLFKYGLVKPEIT